MPAGWCMVASAKPPMLAVSVAPARHTHKLIRACQAFTIAIPGPGMGAMVEYTGSVSGRDVDKVKAASLEMKPSTKIAPPLLAGAVANFECHLAASLEAGDHTIFVGEVVAAHIDDEAAGRLLNFGPGLYALAQPMPGTEYLVQS